MDHPNLTEEQREADAKFLSDLIRLTGGDAAAWEGFDPSAWRDVDPNDMEDNNQWDAGSDNETGGIIPSASDFKDAVRVSDDWNRPIKHNKARQLVADVPEFTQDPAKLEKESLQWKETGLQIGEQCLKNETFVPWKFVTGYLGMYAGKRNGERAAPLFTLEALHLNRVWDLYYFHQPKKEMGDQPPALFVPTYQFEHLLDVVNAKLEINFTIPHGVNEEKFKLSFAAADGPRPRFLGRSHTAHGFNLLRDKIPAFEEKDDLSLASAHGRGHILSVLQMISKASTKSKKADNTRYKRTILHKAWGRTMKRAQRYLGLREKIGQRVDGTTPQMLDLDQPIATKPERSVLFVCIDIEAYEFNQDLITEVGISVLDTRKLVGVAPGLNGENWFDLMESRHLRVEDNVWAVNTKFVHGCADRFIFGKTEMVRLRDVPKTITEIINNGNFAPADFSTQSDQAVTHGQSRPVVLVFHDASSDIKYLHTAGYDVRSASNVVDVLDTKHMHQYTARTNNNASLENVLRYLDVPYQYLHNAGNDAAYTLRVMVGLAVKKRMMSLEKALSGAPKGYIPVNEFKEKEGWTSGGEDTDGGEPAGPVLGGWN
ncbi:good for full DBP5 activity protein 2 [Podospora fimiseda]|uniref:Good for full DBP5 activity protein 2 n=1 Tax=Podospora fimiseda TaxID=252190 RepID=A0AAN7BIK2_9PEZI|nr:good for full DBP5 activity protein 2 [Podospora fimiseda]